MLRVCEKSSKPALKCITHGVNVCECTLCKTYSMLCFNHVNDELINLTYFFTYLLIPDLENTRTCGRVIWKCKSTINLNLNHESNYYL